MKLFSIYQAVGPEKFTETEDQIRIYVGHVEANSFEMAYRKSQNTDIPWNFHNPCRSTSVGDVIECDGKFHMVSGMGFKELVFEEEQDAVSSDLYDVSAE
jgi:hypothetical protein